ncbi:hypothetical protein GCM10009630_11380 [Kribbella jejuensis]|uniref:Uncharacterized protein n=1 Tax=Kribbella jejuensis TaxID=236068 RepID=A0A542E9W9_9ACTN|nr:hypothetical protein [Kribbella jejuensis]TQJ12120.1 hypothetical protein FB475_5048 [Kribbella jejuensis]
MILASSLENWESTVGNELVKIDGRDVLVQVPRHLAGQVAVKALVPVITTTVRALAAAAREVTTVTVEAVHQQRAQLALMNYEARVIARDIVPILATSSAHQRGRNLVERAGFDDDIYADALHDLEIVRQRRRTRNAERWQP